VRLYAPNSIVFEPFLPDGVTASGIVLSFDPRLMPVFGRVILCGNGVRNVAPGDVIVYRPGAFEWVTLSNGRCVGHLHDQAHGRGPLWATIEGYDFETSADTLIVESMSGSERTITRP
jgi:hypothetical protein